MGRLCLSIVLIVSLSYFAGSVESLMSESLMSPVFGAVSLVAFPPWKASDEEIGDTSPVLSIVTI